MKIFVCAPENGISGGPELSHQLCSTLKNNGYEAEIYYYNNMGNVVDTEAPAEFRQYNTCHATKFEDINCEDSIVVLNETSIPLKDILDKCHIVIWWMSVDNYLKAYDSLITDNQDCFGLAGCKEILHLSQSEYSTQFLEKDMHIDKSDIYYLSDYLNDAFFSTPPIPDDMRLNQILYNPRKGFHKIQPLITENPDFKWIPIIGMEKSTIAMLMKFSKLYIDFGNHPGKDRIPREAVISGMCILTNREGSAANDVDIPIKDCYKYKDVDSSHQEIRDMISDIFSNYHYHSQNFEEYRNIIRSEKEAFNTDVEKVFKRLFERINSK